MLEGRTAAEHVARGRLTCQCHEGQKHFGGPSCWCRGALARPWQFACNSPLCCISDRPLEAVFAGRKPAFGKSGSLEITRLRQSRLTGGASRPLPDLQGGGGSPPPPPGGWTPIPGEGPSGKDPGVGSGRSSEPAGGAGQTGEKVG